MKTVPTILPIYDSILKQDQNRTGTKMPVLTPRFRLPSLLWNVQSDAPGEIERIELIDKSNDNANLSSSIANTANGYETLTTSGTTISSAINSAAQATALLNPVFTVGNLEIITLRFTLTLTSGQLPYFYIYYGGGVSSPYFAQAVAGYNEINLQSDRASSTAQILMFNNSASNFATTEILVNRNIITSYFNHTAAYIQNGGGAGWVNNATAYDTFTSVNRDITSAIKTTAAGVASCWNVISVGSVPDVITASETIRIKVVLTLNSGTAPKCVLQRTDTSANISNIVTLSAGTSIIYLTATSTITGFAIAFYNGNGETSNWSAVLTLGEKSVIPKLYALTDDYFQYKGETLGLLLPIGAYYLRITTVLGFIYYSDWFVVTDIYSNLISGWTNIDFNTFTSSGTVITSAIETGASGNCISSSFSVTQGEVIRIKFNLTLNGGTLPFIILKDAALNNVSTGVSAVIGLNDISLTVSSTSTATVYIIAGAAVNFFTTEVIVIKSFSSNFIKIDFDDTHDLGEILYQDGFTQSVYFEQRLAPPTHEAIEVGEEKNGIFIAEKIITKYKYRIIANVGRELYKALIRLPQHDTISITDEVGNVYSPKVGNIQVIPANWIYYDVCRLEIIFNDNTEYVWTSENNNIT